jgi:hypothetical protein
VDPIEAVAAGVLGMTVLLSVAHRLRQTTKRVVDITVGKHHLRLTAHPTSSDVDELVAAVESDIQREKNSRKKSRTAHKHPSLA